MHQGPIFSAGVISWASAAWEDSGGSITVTQLLKLCLNLYTAKKWSHRDLHLEKAKSVFGQYLKHTKQVIVIDKLAVTIVYHFAAYKGS